MWELKTLLWFWLCLSEDDQNDREMKSNGMAVKSQTWRGSGSNEAKVNESLQLVNNAVK